MPLKRKRIEQGCHSDHARGFQGVSWSEIKIPLEQAYAYRMNNYLLLRKFMPVQRFMPRTEAS